MTEHHYDLVIIGAGLSGVGVACHYSPNFPEKNYLIVACIFGILWELFEYYYGKHRPGWLGGDCKNLATDKGEDSNWWYAKFSDIIMNILGLMPSVRQIT